MKVSKWLTDNLAWLVVAFVALLTTVLLILAKPAEDGSRTFDAQPAQISDSTKEWIESAQEAYARIVNQDKPTDEETIKEFADATGQGSYSSIQDVINRILPDGDDDNGNGWQCSKYTAYLATGRREYSTAHPDYGPVNGKDVAAYLVKNYGWRYTDTPVKGAIGSGGFNTTYGHTVVYLYATGEHTAMVNDANWTPLKVGTHNMNIDGWVWVVPGDYEPEPEPTPEPTPTPDPSPVSTCSRWNVVSGDTMGKIMATCEGSVRWGSAMSEYAKTWYSTKVKPGQSVYAGWNSRTGVGLYAGDIIVRNP